MNAAFRRSRWFGIVGVIVVALLAAAIGLLFGQGSDPTLALAAILGLVFAFVAGLLVLQRRDLDRAQAEAAAEAFAAPDPVTDPTLADQTALLAALAVKPIDAAALGAATAQTYGMVRGSIGAGAKIMVLIFCAVVPWQLFQFAWSLVVFVPIIVGYAIYLSVKALAPGGALDRAYDASRATLEPLGLELVERPAVGVRPRVPGPGLQKEITGAVVYSGTRHGRQVEIRLEGGAPATVRLDGAFAPFAVAVKGERLRADEKAPAAVVSVLEPLRPSSYWKGVSARGGPDGIAVERRRGAGEHWMRDLWLAERLADAARLNS